MTKIIMSTDRFPNPDLSIDALRKRINDYHSNYEFTALWGGIYAPKISATRANELLDILFRGTMASRNKVNSALNRIEKNWEKLPEKDQQYK